MENPETPKRRRWVICKPTVIGAIIGALIGALLTAALEFLNFTSDSHNYGAAIFLGLISVPSSPLLFFLGLFGLKYINITNSVSAMAYLIVVNTISYCLIGIIIGCLIQQFRKTD